MKIFVNEHEILLRVIWRSLILDVFWVCIALVLYAVSLQLFAIVIIILIKLTAGPLDTSSDLNIYGGHTRT